MIDVLYASLQFPQNSTAHKHLILILGKVRQSVTVSIDSKGLTSLEAYPGQVGVKTIKDDQKITTAYQGTQEWIFEMKVIPFSSEANPNRLSVVLGKPCRTGGR